MGLSTCSGQAWYNWGMLWMKLLRFVAKDTATSASKEIALAILGHWFPLTSVCVGVLMASIVGTAIFFVTNFWPIIVLCIILGGGVGVILTNIFLSHRGHISLGVKVYENGRTSDRRLKAIYWPMSNMIDFYIKEDIVLRNLSHRSKVIEDAYLSIKVKGKEEQHGPIFQLERGIELKPLSMSLNPIRISTQTAIDEHMARQKVGDHYDKIKVQLVIETIGGRSRTPVDTRYEWN